MRTSRFNGLVHGKAWRVTQYPARWMEVDPETGCILGEMTGTARPRARNDRLVVVSTKRAVPE